jgi:hypothetical protein
MSFAGRTGWQTEAWKLLDAVGELRYYVGWRSNACSKVKIIASELDEQGDPTGECSNARVNEIASKIAGNQHGRAQLIRRLVECLSVPGEAWVAIIYPPGTDPDGPGRWLALSRDEIKHKGREVTIELPEDAPDYTLSGEDSMFRIWVPHPRKAKEADSPVRAASDALYEIVRTTRKIRHADNSRLIGNGVVFVPQEMSLPMSTAPVAADKTGGAPVPPELSGNPAVRELADLLYAAAKTAYEDEDSFASMIPIFASVPGEKIAEIQHITFGTDVTDQAIKTRNDAIARLAMSLDVSPERLLGLGSSTNHWSAWQIGDTDVQQHIAPVMELVCQAITAQVFSQVLEAEGIDSTKYLLWYDASHLTADPDNSENATEAFDRGVITADAYREFLNLGDTGYDLLNGGMPEWKRWAVDRISQDPSWLVQLLPLLDPALQALDFPDMKAVEEGQGSGDGSGTDNQSGPNDTNEGSDPETENKGPGYDQGKRGRPKEVAAHQAIVELMVSRALELAGKRRRNRANHERLRGVPLHRAHKVMGPVTDAEIPELISGWDSALEQDALALVGLDIDVVRTEVKRQVRRELTAQVVDA